MEKRKRLLQGILVIAIIEILSFYFIGRDYLFINGLDNMIAYVVTGGIFFAVSYFLLVEVSNFRKKYILIGIAYVLLVIAPFVYKNHLPHFKVEDAEQIILRTEGGRVVKDRELGQTMLNYAGEEVYIIALKKDGKLKRFAFNPTTEKYFSITD
ncbi:hypothetical protein [Rummeliibacillus sp. BSL5]